MYNLGVGMLISGTIVVFASDIFFRKGKIKDMKSLLKIKSAGLAITIIGMIIMFKMY
jgi:hypothetical protein